MIKLYFKPRFRAPPIKAKRLVFKAGRQTIIFRSVAIFMVFCIIGVLCDMRLRPIISTVGGNALKNTLSNVLDGTVNDMVDQLGVRYGDMVNIERNADGTIAAITLNSTCINGYKADISDGCSDKLSNFTETVVPVPIGSIIGGSFFNGRGACIDIPATIYGFAVTDVVSEFHSAGINQTRHIIYLNVEASAHAYMGLCHLNESVDETIILVETIIVGQVPNSYYVREE
jgi:sporulation protein YunB